MAIAAAQRAAGPTLFVDCTADAEGHQRCTVVEIDTDPVPAYGLTVQVLAGPFVVEPGLACDAIRAALARDGTRHTQMRQAVVIARGLPLPPFAAFSCVPVEQKGLCLLQRQIEGKILRIDLCRVGVCASLQRPMVDPNVGIARGGLGEPQAGAANALLLP